MSDTLTTDLKLNRSALLKAYQTVRLKSEKLAEPLSPEDCVVQTMYDASPTKWNLGHTSWFFERVILHQFIKNYRPLNEDYYFAFNSYYDTFGSRIDRDKRGTLSRPSLVETYTYRRMIDEAMAKFVESASDDIWPKVAKLIELGLHHEQQHQELLLTDIKHIFSVNPFRPTYCEREYETLSEVSQRDLDQYAAFSGGLVEIGAGENSFSYDNERPRHKVYLNDFKLRRCPVTCGEFLRFVEDGGYEQPILWLSDGWSAVTENDWSAPRYWEKRDGRWMIMTLAGLKELNPAEPVAHVSYYEAAAFARWTGKRLPTEVEWEYAAVSEMHELSECNFIETELYHTRALHSAELSSNQKLLRMFGDVWEWTASAYLGYPGYKQVIGALGEYNGKFMANQMVLRGGSCVTARSHIRPTYRNFFHCDKRWQFTGFRLADDA